MPRIGQVELASFAAAVLHAAGLAEVDAAATAAGLADATARGVASHGVARLPQYLRSIGAGEINLKPDVRLVASRGATALVDADGGYGFRPSVLAIDEAVKLAAAFGIGMVGVRASHHFGAAALYTRRAAEAGMIGVAASTSKARIAPTGAKQAVFGNNPLSVAVPRPDPHPPIVLDMALGQVAIGKLRLAAAAGEPVPLGWGYDADGQDTTDPLSIINGGLLAPIGGHKGYGLALMVEILAGVMTGSPFGRHADPHWHRAGGVGHLFLAIDASFLRDRDEFSASVDELVDQAVSAPPGAGQAAVLLPGQSSARHATTNLELGVPVPERLAAELDQLAADLAVARPQWMVGQTVGEQA